MQNLLTQVVVFFSDPWNIFGSVGQLMFASRFVIQWIRSEIAGKSVVPTAFWYCSLAGGILLLVFAVHREEPVFIAGQLPGIFVYWRNLRLIGRERHEKSPA